MNMEEKLFNPGRRAVLAKILAGGALGITGMSGIIRHALAVGGETYPQGIREIRGEVRINGVSAQAGKAPMLNHTDAELIMLESLVGRRPPFVTKAGSRGE